MSFFDRLREPSSWAGIGVVLALVLGEDPNTVGPTMAEAGTAVAAGLAGLLGIFLPEAKK